MSKAVDLNSVSAAYNRYASIYDALFGTILQHGRVTLARVMQTRPGERVLEIGVGSGLMLALYPQHVQVLGIDISEQMLRRAQLKVDRLQLAHVELKLVDAEHNGLASGAFDHVVLPYVYSVTPAPLDLIRESFRLCKPGGSIWILNHFSGLGIWDRLEWLIKPFARLVGFRPGFPYKTYVSDQGWDTVAVHKVNFLGLSRVIQVRNPELESSARRHP
jgi:phosphatidylethanolamine/phosphatidyl-N-methylethanolamine N-methyltransferase